MLARVADSIYWMSRYVERAENVARFIEVNLNLMLDLPVGSAQQWQPLVDTTGDAAEFAKQYGTATQRDVIQFLTFDQENTNSILSCLRGARENARSVREIISSEMWEQLNEFYLRVNSAAADAGIAICLRRFSPSSTPCRLPPFFRSTIGYSVGSKISPVLTASECRKNTMLFPSVVPG